MIGELIPLAIFIALIAGICWLALLETRRPGE